jgi:hypothetical protein
MSAAAGILAHGSIAREIYRTGSILFCCALIFLFCFAAPAAPVDRVSELSAGCPPLMAVPVPTLSAGALITVRKDELPLGWILVQQIRISRSSKFVRVATEQKSGVSLAAMKMHTYSLILAFLPGITPGLPTW